jgi:hypothetical protein
MKSSRGVLAFAVVLGLLAACGSKVDGTDVPDGGDGGGVTGEGGTGKLPDGAPMPTDGGIVLADGAIVGCTPLVLADGTTPQCSDCKDNDGDGLADWFDPECAGPLDNDEKTFGTGIPGDNQDACKQDCFFDGNSGAGDDRCEWNLKCDPKNTAPGQCTYDANFKNCPATQEAQCKSFCLGRTPNGCDCFGCCAVQKSDGSQVTVRLSSTCSLAGHRRPDEVHAVRAGGGLHEPVRPLRALHRQDADPRRLRHRPDARRRAPSHGRPDVLERCAGLQLHDRVPRRLLLRDGLLRRDHSLISRGDGRSAPRSTEPARAHRPFGRGMSSVRF